MTDDRELPDGEALVKALIARRPFPRATTWVELLETHISWLLLTGTHAYKIKKPVNFGFVDFSTLEKRRHFCEEELRLNRRYAPELYLRVVPITGSTAEPRFEGNGPAIEYAVEMVQFPSDARLDRRLQQGTLHLADCDRLAATIAEGHRLAEVATPPSGFGEPTTIAHQIDDTLRIADERLPEWRRLIAKLQAWSQAQFAEIEQQLHVRRREGAVRECHGDLHLENMLLWNDRFLLFDCLEFNPSLRWIDVMSDVAFITMDLTARRRPDMARRLLNRYVEITGDFEGLRVLRYYQAYRASVRAAVAGMRRAQPPHDEQERSALVNKAGEYLDLAERYAQPCRPWMVITRGCSGSGKTTVTQPLVERLGAIRLRSDIERQRWEHSVENGDRYAPHARRRVYEAMSGSAETVLRAGFPVIIDATFLARDNRLLFRNLATRLGVPFAILDFDLPPELLRARVAARSAEGVDASEATLAVVEEQLAQQEALDAGEAQWAVRVSAPIDLAALLGVLGKFGVVSQTC